VEIHDVPKKTAFNATHGNGNKKVIQMDKKAGTSQRRRKKKKERRPHYSRIKQAMKERWKSNNKLMRGEMKDRK